MQTYIQVLQVVSYYTIRIFQQSIATTLGIIVLALVSVLFIRAVTVVLHTLL